MELVTVKYGREEDDCCAGRNSEELVKILRNRVNKNGLFHRFNVSKSRCLGHCSEWPTITVYPDSMIFKKVSKGDAGKIIETFL